MKTGISSFALLALAGPIMSCAHADIKAWQVWEQDLRRQCPSRHVEWVAGGGYDELLGAFESSLARHAQKRILQIVDYSHRCAGEEIGFACEMAISLDAFRKMGLLKRFVEFGCAHVKCEEAALCSKFPHTRPVPNDSAA